MSLQGATEKLGSYFGGGIAGDAAKILLHTLFPEDFEFYMMALELQNEFAVVTDRFIFPVMPDQMSINKKKLTNIRKTAQGISVLNNNSFVPIDININGGFGRAFKLMVGSYETKDVGIGYGGLVPRIPFSLSVKTGYGALKMLDRLFEKSTKSNNGSAKTLVLYNLAYNQQYVVKIMNLNIDQSISENMLWKYSMNLQAVAPRSSRCVEIGFLNGVQYD